MNTSTVYIIQAQDAPADLRQHHGDQGHWFEQALQTLAAHTQILRPHAQDKLPDPKDPNPVLITGSWSMVTDHADWSEQLAAWIRLRHAAAQPLLGVCYGHQLMAYALGGKVDYHPQGRELGCLPLTLNPQQIKPEDDFLVGHLPTTFDALLTHEQSVLLAPAHARILASSQHDPHQILAYGNHGWSVQFHPEFTPTLLAATLQRRAQTLEQQGVKVQQLLAQLHTTPQAHQVLLNFVQHYYAPSMAAARINSPGVSPVSSLNEATNADILS